VSLNPSKSPNNNPKGEIEMEQSKKAKVKIYPGKWMMIVLIAYGIVGLTLLGATIANVLFDITPRTFLIIIVPVGVLAVLAILAAPFVTKNSPDFYLVKYNEDACE